MHLRTATIFPALLVTSMLGSCSAKILGPTDGDTLREQLAKVTTQRDEAMLRESELQTRLATLERERNGAIDPQALAAVATLARVGISGLTMVRETSADTATLALVIVPEDGLGRFLQAAGTLQVSVAALAPGHPPTAAGALTVTPLALRDCYRAGLMGTHYTVEIPLKWSGDDAQTRGTVRAVSVAIDFTDALSGRSFPAAATIPLLPPRTPIAPNIEKPQSSVQE